MTVLRLAVLAVCINILMVGCCVMLGFGFVVTLLFGLHNLSFCGFKFLLGPEFVLFCCSVCCGLLCRWWVVLVLSGTCHFVSFPFGWFWGWFWCLFA